MTDFSAYIKIYSVLIRTYIYHYMARVCNFQMFQHILFLKDRVSILCKANFIVKSDYKEKPLKIINFER